MAKADVISLLRDKRSDLAGAILRLEQQLTQRRADLTHLGAAMLLFDPDLLPRETHSRQPRAHSIWFARH
jgi:hypothetical protein